MIDFGTLTRADGVASRRWRIRNPRGVVHHVTGVVTSCACHAMRLERGPGPDGSPGGRMNLAAGVPLRLAIAPGEEVEVVVELDSRRLGSTAHGTVGLFTDDPLEPAVLARLSASVRELVVVEPAVRELGVLEPGEAREEPLLFEVRRVDGGRLRITHVIESSPGLHAGFHAAVEDATSWRVMVTVAGIEAEGPYFGYVRLATEGSGTVLLQVRGRVRERIGIEPPAALMAGILPPGGRKRLDVSIEAPEDLVLGDVAATWEPEAGCPAEGAVRVEALAPSRARVLLELRAPPEAFGPLRGRVTIRLPGLSRAREIEVYGFVRDP